eukprot:CAMPEP_0118991762 /NCGR_PEP_ID=MMETSP1173-20130426/52238_1 /TAXON_ID=1034831 /ORGANISM="Rhizochromulina marina cf, Strain CCMP1243" /LENGTH=45 /DNA_ID= /DNA_START= /DNA_END= /DNA_ORIENTATION=
MKEVAEGARTMVQRGSKPWAARGTLASRPGEPRGGPRGEPQGRWR